jgi:hypothetical protein
MLRRAALRLAALAVAFAGAACVSPTLPLPPPSEPDTIQPSDEQPGVWVISGDCYTGALVTVFNERTRKGAIVEDSDQNGRYTVEIEAELCDLVTVRQDIETESDGIESSPPTSFVIEERDGSGTPNDACP